MSFKIRRALISVYDKTGVVEFARALHAEFGVEIISTGGTARALSEAGIPVTLVETLTGFGEMLDGRVKTLHPAIHAAILADRDNPEHMRQLEAAGIKPIDLVVVNLYPFEKTVAEPNCTVEQAIEMIDIGGVTLLRAAAKNHKHVLVALGIRSAQRLVEALRQSHDVPATQREHLARVALHSTSRYDRHIAAYLATLLGNTFSEIELSQRYDIPALTAPNELRYGENPQQNSAVRPVLQDEGSGPHVRSLLNIAATERVVGSERPIELGRSSVKMSHNNYLDADAALVLCAELTRAGKTNCVFVKHTNPCGAAVDINRLEAYRKAYLADPNAAMGGILACNLDITPEFAEVVMETYDRFGKGAGAGGFFVEVWIAPRFDDQAVEIIRTRKKWGENVRLLAVGDVSRPPDENELVYRSIAGGMLVQTADLVGLNEEQWKVVTKRAPNGEEMDDLRLAWLVAKHTKSNAISIVKDGMLIGNGAGQMSRVMSCRIATWLARENGHAEKLKGSVAASDAFFPFRDGPDILMGAGVTAIIQPGGSKRDADTIAACDERGVAMIFTGTRHFRH